MSSCRSPPPARGDDLAASAELRAVRALVLDDDVACLVQRDPPGDALVVASSPDVRSISAAAPPRRVNRSRERLQHELSSLRQQAIALQHQLDGITRCDRQTGPWESVLVLAWRTVAQDQRHQEQHAEHAREQLRSAIKDHTRVLKRVRRIVRERILRSHQLQAVTSSRLTVVLAMDLSAGYREIAYQLGRMQPQANAVLRDPRHVPASKSTYLCYRDAFELPFHTHTTAEAVVLSRLSHAARKSIGLEEERVLGSEDAVRRVFSTSFDFPRYKGKVHGLTETRWLINNDRHYFLHCTLATREGRSDADAVAGFELCIRNWTVVSPVTTSDADARPLSRVEMFELTGPGRGARLVGREELVETQGFCREATTYIQSIERQLLENTVLDVARRGASRKNG